MANPSEQNPHLPVTTPPAGDMSPALGVLWAWVAGVNRGDAEGLAGMYAEEAVLLPTFSSNRIRTPAKVLDYFKQLGARSGLGVSVHPNTVKDQPVGSGVSILSGIYRFNFEVDDEPLTFEARFTFVVEPDAQRPILHHHSSQIPRTLT